MAKKARQVKQVAWVDPPAPIGGLDHIGTLAPCIHVYGMLLPGITNVTDRARYYSLYPWLLWSYEASGGKLDPDEVVHAFRRADCLLTLIAERHAHKLAEHASSHSIAMIGRDTLVPALQHLEAGQAIRLSDYATTAESDQRYFKNRFGGLGQYYRGTLFDLLILDSAGGHVPGYTASRGAALAKRVDAGVPRDLFWRTVTRDTISLKALDDLSAFCPCQLSESKREYEWLLDLFFDRKAEYGAEGQQRRATLLLLLALARQHRPAWNREFDVGLIRDAVYTGHLPGGAVWQVPQALRQTLQGWALYERNEILSVGAQAILAVCTATMFASADQLYTSTDVADALLGQAPLKRIRSKPWSTFVAEQAARLAPLSDFDAESHESSLRYALLSADFVDSDFPELAGFVRQALQLLAALSVRSPGTTETAAYGWLPVPSALIDDYPINLASLARVSRQVWPSLSVAQVVTWLVSKWAVEVHLRTALRKLRGENRDTFRFYPTEHGYRPRIIPEPAPSSPRLRQALRILEDLGALVRRDGAPHVSDLGDTLLQSVEHGTPQAA